MPADFGLIQTPNFAQAALSGYQAGTQMRKQNQLDQALQGVDLERPETLLPLLRADPATGAALIGASVKIHAENRAQQAQAAQAAYVKAAMKPTGATGSQSTAPATAAPQMPDAGAPADITVTAASPAPSLEAAQNAAIDADPEQFMKLHSAISAMDDDRLKKLDAATDAAGSIWQNALNLPQGQRAAYIQTQVPFLVQHGFPAEKVAQIDTSDAGLHGEIGKALGVKEMINQADKARTANRQDAAQAETHRHNMVDESQGGARIGLEGANVGIARQRLHDEETGVIGSKGGAAGGVVSRVINGVKVYRNPADGQLYDNPEFK
jgi:hypothetical protein